MSSHPAGLRENEPLATHTTIGIGGPARHFVEALDESHLRAALRWAAGENVPVFVLGGGSNLLIADEGFPGLVIKIGLRGVTWGKDGEVRLGAGEDWDGFVAQCVERDLAGVECLSGIPGLAGGAPIQNIGAYGQEVAETIARVEAIDRASGCGATFTNAACGFGYRTSRFKHGTDRDRFVVSAVVFRLQPGGAAAIRYADLTRHFGAAGIASPSLPQVREAVLTIRRGKAMVFEPDVEPNSRSCGSFFTNPIVPRHAADAALARLRATGALGADERAPIYEAGGGLVKLSAAWLMERSGLSRGHVHGKSGLSERHVLALVNRGGATAAEVLDLMRHVQHRVEESSGIRLEPEPTLLGFGP